MAKKVQVFRVNNLLGRNSAQQPNWTPPARRRPTTPPPQPAPLRYTRAPTAVNYAKDDATDDWLWLLRFAVVVEAVTGFVMLVVPYTPEVASSLWHPALGGCLLVLGMAVLLGTFAWPGDEVITFVAVLYVVPIVFLIIALVAWLVLSLIFTIFLISLGIWILSLVLGGS